MSASPPISACKQALFVTLGVLLVAVGAIGALVPGIPTVGPLLGASFFLARGCPALERRLVRHRFFARYQPYLDGTRAWPKASRVAAMLSMWCSILLSASVFAATSTRGVEITLTLFAAGLVGSLVIGRIGHGSIGPTVNTAR